MSDCVHREMNAVQVCVHVDMLTGVHVDMLNCVYKSMCVRMFVYEYIISLTSMYTPGYLYV